LSPRKTPRCHESEKLEWQRFFAPQTDRWLKNMPCPTQAIVQFNYVSKCTENGVEKDAVSKTGPVLWNEERP
jgi:hypothetical protein